MAAVNVLTNLDTFDRRAIAASLHAHEFFRRGRALTLGARGYREWQHFFVATDELELFVNLSVFDDLRPAASHRERARVLVFVRRAGRWDGDVDEVAPAELELHGGQLAARFGHVEVHGVSDGIVLRGRLRERPIAFDLSLESLSVASLAADVRVGRGGAINWLVVPRLVARGVVQIGGARHTVDGAAAYHDHNWGTFAHRDFRWQWGHAQATSGESIVLARLLDGNAGTAYLQSLFVWRGPRITRIFRGADLTLTPSGFLRRRSFTLPRFGSVLASGATEVPARVSLEAHTGDDRLRGELVFDDAACIVLGEDRDLGTTLLYEVLGRIEIDGCVAGAPFALSAPIVFETMRRA